MRAPIAAFLTGIVFLNLFGFYLLFMIKQSEVKTEMAIKIQSTPSGQFQVLTFDKGESSSLHFSNDGKELTADGKLYDVVSVEHIGRQIHVTVEYDSSETELIQDFVALFNGKTTGEKELPYKDLIKLLQKEFVAQPQTNTLTIQDSNNHYTLQSFSGSAGISAGVTVPPPCCLA